MNAAWLFEFVLEVLGCIFFYRRKFAALWVWLGFRALADLTRFVIEQAGFPRTDIWAEYVVRHAQYVFLAAVCVACVVAILREHPKASKMHQWGMCVVAAYGVALLHFKWPPSPETVLLFEAGTELFLAMFIVLALATTNGKAPRPWGWISGALLLLTISDAIVTLLAWNDAVKHNWANWHYWQSWYPAGAIPALGLLAWAGWRDWRLEEVRLPLPAKTEAWRQWA